MSLQLVGLGRGTFMGQWAYTLSESSVFHSLPDSALWCSSGPSLSTWDSWEPPWLSDAGGDQQVF